VVPSWIGTVWLDEDGDGIVAQTHGWRPAAIRDCLTGIREAGGQRSALRAQHVV